MYTHTACMLGVARIPFWHYYFFGYPLILHNVCANLHTNIFGQTWVFFCFFLTRIPSSGPFYCLFLIYNQLFFLKNMIFQLFFSGQSNAGLWIIIIFTKKYFYLTIISGNLVYSRNKNWTEAGNWNQPSGFNNGDSALCS